MHIRQILQRREAIRTELRSLLESHPGEMPADVAARFSTLQSEAEALNVAEAREAAVADLDRRAAGHPIGGAGDTFEAQAARVTALDVIRAQAGMADEGASRAREVSQEIARRSGRKPEGMYVPMDARPTREQRAFNLTTGAGSSLVQTDIAPSWIDILRAKSIVMTLGATRITGLVGNLALPRLTGSASTYWVQDGTAVTYSNPTVDQVTFSPHHVGGVVTLSRQLIQQSSPSAAAIVENDLAALVATAIDQAALAGTGSSGQPTGILNASGLTIVPGDTNGAAITWANIQELVGSVDTANALTGALGFASNAKVAKSMRKTLRTTTDTASNFILVGNGQLAGYPLASSQNVPSTGTKGTGTGLSSLVFGDWSSLVIAEWSALDILVNPYGTAYAAGGVDVRAMATIDVNFRHVPAFAAITDIIA